MCRSLVGVGSYSFKDLGHSRNCGPLYNILSQWRALNQFSNCPMRVNILCTSQTNVGFCCTAMTQKRLDLQPVLVPSQTQPLTKRRRQCMCTDSGHTKTHTHTTSACSFVLLLITRSAFHGRRTTSPLLSWDSSGNSNVSKRFSGS